MGNTNEVVAEFVTDEKRQEIFLNEFKQKFYPIIISRWRQVEHLYYYYKNIEEYDSQVGVCNKYQYNYLYRFKWYDTYELVNDTYELGKMYRVAMINYIYKWYSNSKC